MWWRYHYAIRKAETYEERNTWLCKSKAWEEPPSSTCSHKVSEIRAVAGNSGKTFSGMTSTSEFSNEITILVSLVDSPHQVSSLQKDVCNTRGNNINMKDDKVVMKGCYVVVLVYFVTFVTRI